MGQFELMRWNRFRKPFQVPTMLGSIGIDLQKQIGYQANRGGGDGTKSITANNVLPAACCALRSVEVTCRLVRELDRLGPDRVVTSG